jgi:hypothetical protein
VKKPHGWHESRRFTRLPQLVRPGLHLLHGMNDLNGSTSFYMMVL